MNLSSRRRISAASSTAGVAGLLLPFVRDRLLFLLEPAGARIGYCGKGRELVGVHRLVSVNDRFRFFDGLYIDALGDLVEDPPVAAGRLEDRLGRRRVAPAVLRQAPLERQSDCIRPTL